MTIDKLDKTIYIKDWHKNYEPTAEDIFIKVKKTGVFQRLIWGEPVKLKDVEKQRWEEFQ